MSIDVLRDRLGSAGQAGVFRFYDSLDEAGKQKLSGQLSALDLDQLPSLIDGYVRNKPKIDLPSQIEPVKAYPREPKGDQVELYAKAKARGEELLKQGKVAAFLVAGGQGTRLGYDGPKGEYPV